MKYYNEFFLIYHFTVVFGKNICNSKWVDMMLSSTYFLRNFNFIQLLPGNPGVGCVLCIGSK